ncbi:uncharacterized protein DS421_7g207290 [Arachis hypogaea]|nr:uncharacterized protein DS421_7g207290 [Arachis hypogaea]
MCGKKFSITIIKSRHTSSSDPCITVPLSLIFSLLQRQYSIHSTAIASSFAAFPVFASPFTTTTAHEISLFIAVLPSAHIATTVSTLRHFSAMKLMEAALCNVFKTVLKIFERKSLVFAY